MYFIFVQFFFSLLATLLCCVFNIYLNHDELELRQIIRRFSLKQMHSSRNILPNFICFVTARFWALTGIGSIILFLQSRRLFGWEYRFTNSCSLVFNLSMAARSFSGLSSMIFKYQFYHSSLPVTRIITIEHIIINKTFTCEIWKCSCRFQSLKPITSFCKSHL